MRIIPDENEPSAAIEIPLEKPLPDYDLDELAKPTPRDVDGILVTQGFRDLVDDARGILTELIAGSSARGNPARSLEITQLTGAICPDEEESYRPGLWIVLLDAAGPAKSPLSQAALQRIYTIAGELVKRLQLA